MKIAVSACLLGVPCRFDGRSKPSPEVIEYLEREGHEVVRVCPEVMGGLSIPHPPSELQATPEGLRVVDCEGADNTEAFVRGAQKACAVAQSAGCTHALLKAKSPSCGVGCVYDGTFSKTLVPGNGVAAQLFMEAGFTVATEETFQSVFKA